VIYLYRILRPDYEELADARRMYPQYDIELELYRKKINYLKEKVEKADIGRYKNRKHLLLKSLDTIDNIIDWTEEKCDATKIYSNAVEIEKEINALMAYELGIEEVPVIVIRKEKNNFSEETNSRSISRSRSFSRSSSNSNLAFHTPEPPFEYKDIYPVKYSSEGLTLKVVRAGKEFTDDTRGGTWYSIEHYPGKIPSYAVGAITPGVFGVGGKEIWRKTIVLRNPYYIDITDRIEAEYPLDLYEELFGKKVPRRGLMGAKAEERYAKIERDISAELINRLYDGVVFYYKIGVHSIPDQVFVVVPSIEKELIDKSNNYPREEKKVYHPKLEED
jgi:hypothetical protein